MKNNGISIFLACAAGAFIGVLIGRWVSISFISQLVGVAAGAGSAYLLYRPGEVLSAIRQVFVWEMDSKRFKLCMLHAYNTFVFSLAALSFIGAFAGVMVATERPSNVGEHAHFYVDRYLYIQAFATVIAILVGITSFFTVRSIKSAFQAKRFVSGWLNPRERTFLNLHPSVAVLILLNPITFPITIALICIGVIAILLPMLMWQTMLMLLKSGPKAVTWLAVRVKRVFILIHSDIRTICLIDGGIGTAIGMCFHCNPIIGALAGGILGVVNYYIVSIKILKLRPA